MITPAPVRHAAVLAAVIASASAQLKTGTPESAGMSASGLARAATILESEVAKRHVGAASILVARRGTIVLHQGFGRLSSKPDSPAVGPDSIYLAASITKPVTAASLMLLVERGLVSLQDPVRTYLPEFAGGERDKVLVRDLLAHTSGLPDMLPENSELRRAHAPLSEFVKRTYSTPLLFAPGTSWRYQSMGVLLAAEIIERVTRMPLRDFEQREIFEPLGMRSTVLGLGRLKINQTVEAWTDPAIDPKDVESWGWNTPYWRDLGAPWGGLHTSTSDLAVLLETFLEHGSFAGKRIFSRATVRVMTSNQNSAPIAPWGLGWAVGRTAAYYAFGDLVSPRTFGHNGATGTVAWADPETQLVCVILTNRGWAIDEGRLLRLVSNVVAASVTVP
jgi:CubicO group peptidase (beta-lactamase class C family)